MLRAVGPFRRGVRDRARGEPGPRLRSAEEALARYRDQGADLAAALDGSRQQLAGLRRELDEDDRWERLVRLARQAGDPWNADDWPLGFDALVVPIPLCTHLSFECARCPVGQRQDGRSCAHLDSAFGRVGELVRRGDRDGLRAWLDELRTRLVDRDPA